MRYSLIKIIQWLPALLKCVSKLLSSVLVVFFKKLQCLALVRDCHEVAESETLTKNMIPSKWKSIDPWKSSFLAIVVHSAAVFSRYVPNRSWPRVKFRTLYLMRRCLLYAEPAFRGYANKHIHPLYWIASLRGPDVFKAFAEMLNFEIPT